MSILVFKTNMIREDCGQKAANAPNGWGTDFRWNTDLDMVLRVETAVVTADAIIRVMREAVFTCDELIQLRNDQRRV